MSKHNNNLSDSATKCWNCKNKLTISQDINGARYCTNCAYFDAMRIYTIEDYNNWLKR